MAKGQGSIYEQFEEGQATGYEKGLEEYSGKKRGKAIWGGLLGYKKAKTKSYGEEDEETRIMGEKAARERAGRRAMFAAGGEDVITSGQQLAEDMAASGQVGVSKALAVAPGTDIRSLSGLATESQVGADVATGQARKEAAVGMMDVAKAMEEMGSEAEDFAAKKAEIDAGINAIIEKYKGSWNDDETAMSFEIRDMVRIDPTIPPKLKAYAFQKARDIKRGAWDV